MGGLMACETQSNLSHSTSEKNHFWHPSSLIMAADKLQIKAELACFTCKTRKKKCDKILPRCGYCTQCVVSSGL